MSKVHPNYICSITKQIFFDPVIASDGFTYEITAIEEWFSKKSTSPTTNLRINNTLTANHAIKQLVDELCEKNEKISKERFKIDYSYISNTSKIHDIINHREFKELLKYNSFDAKKLYYIGALELLFKNCKNIEVITHFLDNLTQAYDTDFLEDDNGVSLNIFTIAINKSNLIAIKYMSQKMKTLATGDNLYYSCIHSTYEVIDYFLKNNMEMNILNQILTIRGPQKEPTPGYNEGEGCFINIMNNNNLNNQSLTVLIRDMINTVGEKIKQYYIKKPDEKVTVICKKRKR